MRKATARNLRRRPERDFRDAPLLERIETVRVVIVHDRSRMFIRTPRHTIYHEAFDTLGSDRKTQMRRALLYIRNRHSFGGRVVIRCGIVEGERIRPNTDRTAFRERERCFACSKTRHLTNHHIVPRSRNGEEDTDNLVVLCQPCHGSLEKRIGIMESVWSPPLTYADYAAILVTFTLAQRHVSNKGMEST